jgi:hypothetical protein
MLPRPVLTIRLFVFSYRLVFPMFISVVTLSLQPLRDTLLISCPLSLPAVAIFTRPLDVRS